MNGHHVYIKGGASGQDVRGVDGEKPGFNNATTAQEVLDRHGYKQVSSATFEHADGHSVSLRHVARNAITWDHYTASGSRNSGGGTATTGAQQLDAHLTQFHGYQGKR